MKKGIANKKEHDISARIMKRRFESFKALANRELEKYKRDVLRLFSTYRYEQADHWGSYVSYSERDGYKLNKTELASLKRANQTIKDIQRKRGMDKNRRLDQFEKAKSAVADCINKARRMTDAKVESASISFSTPEELAELRRMAGVTYKTLIAKLGKAGLDSKAIAKDLAVY